MAIARLSLLKLLPLAVLGTHLLSQTPRTFSVWVFSDAHAAADLRGSNWNLSDAVDPSSDGRESLATALRQSEAADTGFPWDVALDLGDLSGAQCTPKDDEGKEIVRQFSVLRRHRREQIYDI